jgi:flagellar biogenesis protein FliO
VLVNRAINILFIIGLIFYTADSVYSKDNGKNNSAKKTAENQSEAGKNKDNKDNDESGQDKTEKETSVKKDNEKNQELNFKDEDFRPKVEDESAGWLMFKALAVIGLMGAGFYFFFKFVTQKAGISHLGGAVVTQLASVPVGQNKFIQVVDIAGKVLVVGVADGGINLLTEITDKNEIDRIRLIGSQKSAAGTVNFQEYISKHLGRFKEVVNDISARKRNDSRIVKKTESGVDLAYLKSQKDRLKNINGRGNE